MMQIATSSPSEKVSFSILFSWSHPLKIDKKSKSKSSPQKGMGVSRKETGSLSVRNYPFPYD